MNDSSGPRGYILSDEVDDVAEFVDSCVEGVTGRPSTPLPEARRPLLTDTVDEVSEFTDGPAQGPDQVPERAPLLADVVDDLVEFSDEPTADTAPVEGPPGPSPAPDARPTTETHP